MLGDLNKNTFKQFLIILLILFSGVYLYSLFFATTNADEAALAEQSWWLNKVGFVKSTLWDGMGIGWEIRQYHHHKLFVLAGAFIYKFLGSSLYLFRLLSYVFFLLTAYLIHKYIKNQGNIYNKNATVICLLILLINVTMLEFGMISRPETMVMTLGFISFYMLNQGIRENNKKLFYLAAVVAGLSGFTHLNGLSFIFAGFVLLIMHKQYLHAIGFGFVGTLFALLYFYDLTAAGELHNFWVQFKADPNLEKTDFQIFTPLIKIMNEQMRFFWNPNMASFSLLLLISIVFFYKSIRQKQFKLFVYFIALVVGLASVSHGKTIKYGLLYFPYIALLITYALGNLKDIPVLKQRILIGTLSVFVAINTFSIVKYVGSYIDSIGRVEMISTYMPKKNTNIMANEGFYFYGWDNYRIHSQFAFEWKYLKYLKRTATVKDFYEFAEARKNHYIVLDQYAHNEALLELLNFKSMKEGQSFYNYSVIKRGTDFAVLELNNNRSDI